MTADHLDPQHWVPYPRPASGPPPVAVHRRPDDDVLGLTAEEAAQAAAAGPQVSDLGDGWCAVRFWHHAPTATAVALAASGWWSLSPVDVCDLRPVADGWWTLCVDVPADWQVSYRFVEHRGEEDPPWWERGIKDPGGVAVPDATNPLRHAAGRGQVSSVLRCPDAQRSWLGGAETPEPAAFRAQWPCWAWSSGGDGPLPLLVITDGRAHLEQLATHRLLRAAVDEGVLPPLAAVFVDSGPDRQRDLGVPGGQARWIAEDLVPTLRRDGVAGSAVTTDPHRTVVVGSSFGALTALFTVARAPEVVGAAIAQSVSLWRYADGALVPPLVTAGRQHPLRLRLQAGTEEGLVPAVSSLGEALTDAGLEAGFAPRSGGHDWAWWVPGMVDAASELLRSIGSRPLPRTSAT